MSSAADMGKISFLVNGEECSVGSETSSDLTLVDYLRAHLELRGTKYMCREGGCGACIVYATTGSDDTPKAVNSCLVSVMSCQSWNITTIEHIGNKLIGYHPIQQALAKENGTQCGYCSPGWVMAMYSLLKSKKNITMLEIENSFGSNICRCTGYRPILDAFKKFATDSLEYNTIPDIEDLHLKCIRKTIANDKLWCMVSKEDVTETSVSEIQLKDGKVWYMVENIKNIFDILELEGDDSYMLVSGNTAKGVYPIMEYPRVLINVAHIKELRDTILDQNLIIGAGTTLSELMDICQEFSEREEYFRYLEKFNDHLKVVAHIPVRNLGSIGGNLMLKNHHKEFPSDLFLLFATVGAQVTILMSQNEKNIVSMEKFTEIDMKGKILFNVILPPLSDEHHMVTYKVAPRAQNAHAIVNAGFLYKLSKEDDLVKECRIFYGGLSKSYTRASNTEHTLTNKNLFTNETVQLAVDSLQKELIVEENPPEPAATYRKQLSIGLFYKGLLTLCPKEKIDPRYASGSFVLNKIRPVSKGLQEFNTDPLVYPLNKPVQKVEAMIQCSGEALYTDDIPTFKHEVYAAYVTSKVAVGEIDVIDSTEAMKEQGVIAFYTAIDIPGQNNFMPTGFAIFVADEEVLCSGIVKYYDQPIGIMVAESQYIADKAATMVKIIYKNVRMPDLDIKEMKHDPDRSKLLLSIPAINKGFNTKKVIKTEYTIYGQYNFCMETMACVTRPTEEGLEVSSSTQWTDVVQNYISRALNIQQNKIDVRLRRLGGSFGLKITRATQLAIACSLVTQKLNRPCRFIQSMTSVMTTFGKRFPCSTNFEIGVSRRGVIQYMDYNIFEDNGYISSELIALLGVSVYSNCYDRLRWNYKVYNTNTDNAKSVYCRAPGTLEHIVMTEWAMEQISYELNLDPLQVRTENLDVLKYASYKEMVDTITKKSNYTERRKEVDDFNKANRWKKRGLRWAFMKWDPLSPAYFDINLSVYHGDGSVIITHGGVEMGQGINTKCVQICAYFLNIPMEKVQIKTNDTTSSPNSFLTGSSITSQNIGRGVEKCCKELLMRLAPVRLLLLNPTWEKLIEKAFRLNIDLQVHEFIGDIVSPISTAMGITLAETEVDILTGESQILRVDLLEDVGKSVSPSIDIGQVEGAFIMGVGYWTSEKLVYDKNSGQLLTQRSWNYKVPQARDIPQDFRVYFRENSYSSEVALGAKVVGEPPICMSVVVPFSIREAIASARLESGIPWNEWFQIDGPYTTECICMSSATKVEDFKLY